MITHRYLTLFFSMTAGLAVAQPQSTNTLTADSKTTDLPTANAPRKPTAGESPVYIKAYGFYGLLTPGSQIATSYSSGGNGSYKNNSTGLGAGPRAGVGIGLILSDFINIGIDADMLFGADLKTNDDYSGTGYKSTGSSTTTLKVLSITPNIMFKALSRPSYYIYNRLGLVGGIVMDYKFNQTYLYAPTTGTSNTTTSQTNYDQNSLAIGYQAAIGIQFRLSQSLRGFAEIVAYSQSFKPKEAIYTSVSTQSGKTSTNYQSVTQYKSQGDYTSTTQNGVDHLQAPSYNVVMNSIGVGVGLVFRL